MKYLDLTPFKVLSSKEKKDQRMILGDHYQDKEFLRFYQIDNNDTLSLTKTKRDTTLNVKNKCCRSIFEKLENKEIQTVMEEGFLFLTERFSHEDSLSVKNE